MKFQFKCVCCNQFNGGKCLSSGGSSLSGSQLGSQFSSVTRSLKFVASGALAIALLAAPVMAGDFGNLSPAAASFRPSLGGTAIGQSPASAASFRSSLGGTAIGQSPASGVFRPALGVSLATLRTLGAAKVTAKGSLETTLQSPAQRAFQD